MTNKIYVVCIVNYFFIPNRIWNWFFFFWNVGHLSRHAEQMCSILLIYPPFLFIIPPMSARIKCTYYLWKFFRLYVNNRMDVVLQWGHCLTIIHISYLNNFPREEENDDAVVEWIPKIFTVYLSIYYLPSCA